MIDDPVALANVSASIPKPVSAVPDPAPTSVRPQSGEELRFDHVVVVVVVVIDRDTCVQPTLVLGQLQVVPSRRHLEDRILPHDLNLLFKLLQNRSRKVLHDLQALGRHTLKWMPIRFLNQNTFQ